MKLKLWCSTWMWVHILLFLFLRLCPCKGPLSPPKGNWYSTSVVIVHLVLEISWIVYVLSMKTRTLKLSTTQDINCMRLEVALTQKNTSIWTFTICAIVNLVNSSVKIEGSAFSSIHLTVEVFKQTSQKLWIICVTLRHIFTNITIHVWSYFFEEKRILWLFEQFKAIQSNLSVFKFLVLPTGVWVKYFLWQLPFYIWMWLKNQLNRTGKKGTQNEDWPGFYTNINA